MWRSILHALVSALFAAATLSAIDPVQRKMVYGLHHGTVSRDSLRERFTTTQLELLEKLNRADRDHLHTLPERVVPDRWKVDELAYSPLPVKYPSSRHLRKLLVVHLAGQAFGAYESGVLVRWGPISSGASASPTPTGLFNLNWRSSGDASTVDPDWYMRWYFNFGNREGLAFHEYALVGQPASHGCLRLLERDALWLFDWGETWTLDHSGTRIVSPGTTVQIVEQYGFAALPPWRSLAWLSRPVELPRVDFDEWQAGADR